MCNIYLVWSDFLWFVCCHAWGPMPLALYEPFAMPCPPSNGIATGIATKLQKIVITELYIGCLKLTGQLYFPEAHMCGPVWSWHLCHLLRLKLPVHPPLLGCQVPRMQLGAVVMVKFTCIFGVAACCIKKKSLSTHDFAAPYFNCFSM